MWIPASRQCNMKTSTCADSSSQLSESFVRELQWEGVTANNLASSKTSVASMDETWSEQDHSPEIYYRQNSDGDTQLHLSIILDKLHVSMFLIDSAPNPSYLDITNDESLTALHCAVLTGQYKIARKLVLAGANAEARTNQGDTALHLAVKERHMQCVKALTDPLSSSEKESLAKSNIPRTQPQLPVHVDARNYTGQTALHIAACKNDVELVHQLLLIGADVNAKEGLGGRTALHLSIEMDNAEVVHYLAQIPTTLATTMYGGEAAYQIALECRPQYVQTLLKHGAVPVIHTRGDDCMSEGGGSDGDYDVSSYMEYTDSYSNLDPKFASFTNPF